MQLPRRHKDTKVHKALIFNDLFLVQLRAFVPAAGDVFSGAMAVAISEGIELADAMAFANKAASISVTRMGAQASAPYRKEIGI